MMQINPFSILSLLSKELLECVECIEWTAEIGTYRCDSYL